MRQNHDVTGVGLVTPVNDMDSGRRLPQYHLRHFQETRVAHRALKTLDGCVNGGGIFLFPSSLDHSMTATGFKSICIPR